MHHILNNTDSALEEFGAEGQQIARLLTQKKAALATSFLSNAAITEKWRLQSEQHEKDRDSFVETEFFAFVDYLALYFGQGECCYRNLYIGEKLKQLYDPALDYEGNHSNKIAVLERDRRLFEELAKELNPQTATLFLTKIDEMHHIVLGEAQKILKVFCVGDCLFLDLLAFLAAPLHQNNISLFPTFATSKNPSELRESIKQKAQEKFDLVIYSPFSYEFNVMYSKVLTWKNALISQEELKQILDQVWLQTKTILELLADLFDCPIFIHNSAAIVMEQSPMKRTLKRWLTSRIRQKAKNYVNGHLEETISALNARTYPHVYLIDENQLISRYGEHKLGAFLYHTVLQHPAQFGLALAYLYWEILFTHTYLKQKKLVVCDLDDTLWEGVIGEGKVHHHTDRQAILLELKKKGIVLAINSKNDPQNVKWNGALLKNEDFVASYISWDPKTLAIRKMQQDLNLKYKDYIFLDDRPEERELISTAFPEIDCLDASKPQTWELLNVWQQLLTEVPELDRTQLYQERELRKRYIHTEEGSGEGADQELFNALKLVLTVRPAIAGDLPRVTELINRTNQFNINGTRTTFKEMQQALASPEYRISIGEARDRFGAMGIVSVLVSKTGTEFIDIVTFVLSCRVFGYGIEKAMINDLKSQAIKLKLPLRGTFCATDRNQPCAQFFENHGFTFEDEKWWWKADVPDANVAWLTVENRHCLK